MFKKRQGHACAARASVRQAARQRIGIGSDICSQTSFFLALPSCTMSVPSSLPQVVRAARMYNCWHCEEHYHRCRGHGIIRETNTRARLHRSFDEDMGDRGGNSSIFRGRDYEDLISNRGKIRICRGKMTRCAEYNRGESPNYRN